jgi:hypothetical protein
MTILVAAAAFDGLVLASDSRTTFLSGRRHRVASDHARKITSPYDGIGIATHGSALIGDQTTAGVVDEFTSKRSEASGRVVDEITRDVATYFGARLEEQAKLVKRDLQPGTLGLVVAGYDATGVGRLREILLPKSDEREAILEHDEVNTQIPGLFYRGRTHYIRRMVEGFDPDGLPDVGLRFPKKTHDKLRQLGYVLKRPLSVQDALDLATFLVRMTIDMERLSDGTLARPGAVPGCGGAIQALAVTGGRTRWVAQPKLRLGDAGEAEDG